MALSRARTLSRQAAAVARAQFHLRDADVARTVRLYGRPAVRARGTMIIRDRVRLMSTVATLELAVEDGARLEIGDRTFVNYGTSIAALQSVRIGPDCNIGTYCLLMDNDFHRLEPDRRMERPPSRPIELGANVWLGGRVIVLPGVTIGDDSVVAAGSVVNADVAARTLVAGVPARPIRSL